jgi:hypothetical protein
MVRFISPVYYGDWVFLACLPAGRDTGYWILDARYRIPDAR